MRKLPILFSAPMVRAILREIEKPDTGKTQTRRVVDFPGIENVLKFSAVATDQQGRRVFEMKDANGQFVTRPAGKHFAEYHFWPKYAVGDRLYVREAWRAARAYDDLAPSEMGGEEGIRYEADGSACSWTFAVQSPGRLRQGMHMPRWASRITLIVTDVRVLQLQEISGADAIAEGLIRLKASGRYVVSQGDQHFGDAYHDPRETFRNLWDSLNAPRGHGWETNPWVAAYTFKPFLKNIDDMLAHGGKDANG